MKKQNKQTKTQNKLITNQMEKAKQDIIKVKAHKNDLQHVISLPSENRSRMIDILYSTSMERTFSK